MKFKKAFTQLSRQNYYEALKKDNPNRIDDVYFGNYAEDGGCEFELTMAWIPLQNKYAPRLEIFNDAFKCFTDHKELFEKLITLNDTDFTADEFSRFLIDLGYEDMSHKKLP